jgi:hypothetical protein
VFFGDTVLMRKFQVPVVSLRLLAVSIALLTCTPARSAVVTVYSNFSEDPSAGLGYYPYACSDVACDNLQAYGVQWNQATNYGSYGFRPFGAQEAMPFTVTAAQNLYLYQVQLAMYKWPDGSVFDGSGDTIAVNHNNLTIQLESNTGGLPSGNVLETLAVNPNVAEDGETFLKLSSSSRTLLQAGQTYWIVATPTVFDTTDTGEDSLFGWMENQEGAQWNYTVNEWNISYNSWNGGFQGFFSQSSPFTAPALNVFATTDLTAAPEPSTAVSAGLALAGLVAGRRYLGRAKRFSAIS